MDGSIEYLLIITVSPDIGGTSTITSDTKLFVAVSTISGYIFIEHLFFEKNYRMVLYESLGMPS